MHRPGQRLRGNDCPPPIRLRRSTGPSAVRVSLAVSDSSCRRTGRSSKRNTLFSPGSSRKRPQDRLDRSSFPVLASSMSPDQPRRFPDWSGRNRTTHSPWGCTELPGCTIVSHPPSGHRYSGRHNRPALTGWCTAGSWRLYRMSRGLPFDTIARCTSAPFPSTTTTSMSRKLPGSFSIRTDRISPGAVGIVYTSSSRRIRLYVPGPISTVCAPLLQEVILGSGQVCTIS